jgi:hypothetical protein
MVAPKGLWESRRFWLLVLDTVISISLYFVGRYAVAQAEDLKFLMLALQPIFIAVILGYTSDNAAEIRANGL